MSSLESFAWISWKVDDQLLLRVRCVTKATHWYACAQKVQPLHIFWNIYCPPIFHFGYWCGPYSSLLLYFLLKIDQTRQIVDVFYSLRSYPCAYFRVHTDTFGGLDRWVVFFIFLFEHLIVCAMSLFLGGSGFGIAVRLRKLSFRRHFQSLASRNNNKALTQTDKEKPPAIGEQRITAKFGNNGGSDWPADWYVTRRAWTKTCSSWQRIAKR